MRHYFLDRDIGVNGFDGPYTGENRRFAQRVLDWTSLTASKRAALEDAALGIY